jgi:quercetin dioxygenase-like cupin family protein
MTRMIEPGLTRIVLTQGAHMMLVEHRMQRGWNGVRHSHPHEQLVFVLSGRIRVTCGEQEPFEASAGDSFVVLGDVSHQVSALAESRVLDVFTPLREDY